MTPPEDPRPPAARLLGRKLETLDPASRSATLSFEAVPAFTNRHGSVHGGFLAAMLDSAAANALWPCLPPGMTALTTRLDTRFVAAAQVGLIKASACLVRINDRDAVVEAQLFDPQGKVLATACVEFRLRPERNPA